MKYKEILGNRVLIKVTRGIESKQIKRNDGSFVNLITKVETYSDTADDNELYKNSGVVCAVNKRSKLMVGDKVWFDRNITSNKQNIIEEGEDFIIYYTTDTTIYFKEDLFSEKNGRQQLDARKGDILSETPIWVIERDGELYGNDNWYLLSGEDEKNTSSGIIYKEETNKAICIAPQIDHTQPNLKGKNCLLEIVQGTVMTIDIKINDKNFRVVSYSEIVGLENS